MLNCVFDKPPEEPEVGTPKCSPSVAGAKGGKITNEGWLCTIGDSLWLFPSSGPARKISDEVSDESATETKDTTKTNRPKKLTAKETTPKDTTASEQPETRENVSSQGESDERLIMIDLTKEENSQIPSPKTTMQAPTPVITQSKPTPRAARKLSAHKNDDELLKSQKPSKSTSPELRRIEKNWVTMVGDDLWIFPPRGPARKLSQEEVSELEQNGFQKPKTSSQPPSSQKMTLPLRTRENANSASRTAPKRSLETIATSNDRKKPKLMNPVNSETQQQTVKKRKVIKAPLIKKTEKEKLLEKSVGVGATRNGWVCQIGTNRWIFPPNAPARKLSPDEEVKVSGAPKSRAPARRSNPKNNSSIRTRPRSSGVNRPEIHPSRSNLVPKNRTPPNFGNRNRTLSSPNSRGFNNTSSRGSGLQRSMSNRKPQWAQREQNGISKPSWNTSLARSNSKPSWAVPKSVPSWNTEVRLTPAKRGWNNSGKRGWEGSNSNSWRSESSANRNQSSIDRNQGRNWGR